MAEKMDRDLKRFSRVLNEYLAYNKRDQGALIENRANRIRWGLFRKFKDLAPSASQVESEALAYLRSGRGIRLRSKNGKRLTVRQEIRERRRSVKYLSIAWLLRQWKASRTGQSGTIGQINRSGRRIGEVMLRTAKGIRSPSVKITSYLEGAVIQDREKSIVSSVLRDETADMGTYVGRKQKQEFRKMVSKFGLTA